MAFYQSIADYYQYIFPLNNAQVDFIKSAFDKTENLKLLDIGCGIGELSFALSKHFKSVEAIDLDEGMMKRAKHDFESKTGNLHFKNMNMLNIEDAYGKGAFDAVICFGNTLVHLNGPNEVVDFFTHSKQVLKDNGRLLFQVINYDRIIDREVTSLPTIENEQIQFLRNYNYIRAKNRIEFETQLTIRSTGKIIRNTIQLYPIRKNEIVTHLKQAGFSMIQFYSNFNKDNYFKESIPLVVEVS